MGTLREDDEPPLAEGPQPASALLSRLANVFAAPGEVFDEIRAAPVRHANWIVPAVLFILASWLAAAMLISSESVRQQYGQLAEQALEQQV
ncbi:MAG: hypothetical protein RMH97_07610 [Verrucomicrobiales bacterium]|nr:hypothetical protein [Verrucomicrobiales bacterium]